MERHGTHTLLKVAKKKKKKNKFSLAAKGGKESSHQWENERINLPLLSPQFGAFASEHASRQGVTGSLYPGDHSFRWAPGRGKKRAEPQISTG